jgi:tRNA threonylcarbamoyladenosine biosynthesis protein TsaE
MKDHFKFFLKNLEDTEKFSTKLVKCLLPKTCICIRGELGVGKTTLVRYALRKLSNSKLNVKSPTFSLVNTYEFETIRVWHYDLYRLRDKSEIYNLDFELAMNDCIIIEWPEIIEEILPKKRIDIFMKEKAGNVELLLIPVNMKVNI